MRSVSMVRNKCRAWVTIICCVDGLESFDVVAYAPLAPNNSWRG